MDLFSNSASFLDVVLELQNARRFAGGSSGSQDLIVPRLVKYDQAVGDFKDRRSAAVICFQTDFVGVGPVAFEVQDVLYFGAPPSVNRLVIVPHHTQIAMSTSQIFDDGILSLVRVLIFVDEHVIVTARLVTSHIFMLVEQFFGQ